MFLRNAIICWNIFLQPQIIAKSHAEQNAIQREIHVVNCACLALFDPYRPMKKVEALVNQKNWIEKKTFTLNMNSFHSMNETNKLY